MAGVVPVIDELVAAGSRAEIYAAANTLCTTLTPTSASRAILNIP